jgi:microcystin-dependent protein
MGLESGTYVQDLVATNPPATDGVTQGDDHLRLIKNTLRNTFPDATLPLYREKGVTLTGNVSAVRASHKTKYVANTGSGNITLTLPTDLTADDAGWYIDVQKSSASNTLTIEPGASTINGADTSIITSLHTAVRVYWDGSVFRAYYSFGTPTAVDPVQDLMNKIIPAGLCFVDFATTVPDGGYIYLFGQTNLSRTALPALFARWGTTYGAGDGSTTFGAPDVRGRVIAGQDDMGGSSANRLAGAISGLNGDTLGAAGGEEHQLLDITQIPAHVHPGVNAGGSVNSDQTDSGSRYNYTAPPNINTSSGSAGGGLAHNNMQPTIIGNWVAKAH